MDHTHTVLSTGDLSERIERLHITKGGPYERIVVMSLAIPDVAPDDQLHFAAYGGVTHDKKNYDYDVMFCQYCAVADSPEGIGGIEVSEAGGTNISRSMHHHRWIHSGFHVFTEKAAVAYLNAVIYAASSAASDKPGRETYLIVHRDYGRIEASVTRYR